MRSIAQYFYRLGFKKFVKMGSLTKYLTKLCHILFFISAFSTDVRM